MAYTTLGQNLMVSQPSVPCITAAEKARAELDCRIPDVKGLGLGLLGLGFTYGTNTRFAGQDACAVAKLPLCPTPIAAFFPTRATPTAPPPVMVYTASMATTPTRTPPPALEMPKLRRPGIVAIPPPSVLAPQPVPVEKKAFFGLGVGGLLAVLAVGGGAVYYFTRKKKAA